MEIQGAAIINRLNESAAARDVVVSVACCSTNLASPNCSCGLEVRGAACSCRSVRVSSHPTENESGASHAINSGWSPPTSITLQLRSSKPKRCLSRASRHKNFQSGKGSAPAQIFSSSPFGTSIDFGLSETANAACSWFGGAWIGGQDSRVAKERSATITLASFAVTKFAYEKGEQMTECTLSFHLPILPLFDMITRLFARKWLEETGQNVHFRLSIAGSGSQARAVMDGLPADVVSLALPLDVIKIQESGLIDDDWQHRVPNNGVPAETTVCLVTRPGNPKHITDWVDLARSNVSLLTANPKTAGVARWNFLALWGSVTVDGGSEEDAQQFVEDVFINVPVQPRDAREVSDVFFNQEVGDAMITYENEIFLTNEKIVKNKGEPLPYTVPKLNVRVETALAVVDKNARKSGVHEISTAFVEFCFTEPAQREYAKSGFRPYLKSVATEFDFPDIQKLWRVEEEIGDWNFVQDKFFADKAIVDVIEENIRGNRVAV